MEKKVKKETFSGEFEFFSAALKKIHKAADCESVSLFQYFKGGSLLKSMIKVKNGLVFEHDEKIFFEDSADFRKSILTGRPFHLKLAGGNFFYIPYLITDELDLTSFREDNLIFFRLERFDGEKIKARSSEAAVKAVEKSMENFYEVDFKILKNNYARNISAASELSSVFAASIRETDSFKAIITGLEKHFVFDRIRLYLVKEEGSKLVGSYSIDRTGKVKSLEYEKIILEKGAHRFSDILLSGERGDSAGYYKDCIFYLPLKIQDRPLGLAIFDNLLSQIKISREDADILKSFSGQIAMAIDNIALFSKIQELSLHDELTKLPMRRYFNARFQEEFYRAERFGQPLSLIWIDIDYFKEINDTYGHQIGDVALKEVSRVIMSSLRKIDFPCRYGGDEIIIMLPQAGDVEAYGLSKRLLNEIKNIKIEVPFSRAGKIELTASIGIANYPADASKMDELLAKADEALYRVKSAGRNGIITYSEMKKEEAEKAGKKETGN